MRKPQPKMSAYSEAIYTTITPLLGGVVVLLNLIEVAMIHKSKRKSANQMYLLSLSFSDIFVGITMVVLKSMDPFMKTTLKGDIAAYEVYNVLKHVFIRFSLFISIFNLIAITFDRLLAIVYPFYHRSRGKRFRLKITIGVWFVSMFVVVFVYLISRFKLMDVDRYNNLVFPISTYTTAVLFGICYSKIYISIRQSSRNLEKNTSGKTSATQGTEGTAKSDQRKSELSFLRIAFKTVIAFLLCWLPFSTCNLLKAMGKSCGGKDVERSLFTLAFFNSALNPFIYFVHDHRKIYQALKDAIKWRRREENTSTKHSQKSRKSTGCSDDTDVKISGNADTVGNKEMKVINENEI